MSTTDHVDCELVLTAPDQASLRTPEGDHSGRPRLEAAAVSEIAATVDPVAYGSKLFAALLPAETDLLSGYREALAVARSQDKLLRLRLQVAATAPGELHRLRWELLHDPKKSITWSCSREIAFSRCPAVPEPEGEPVTEKPRLLVAIAEPSDLAEYQLPASGRAAAEAALKGALAPLQGSMSWKVLSGPITAARLSETLVSGGFHALHLQAHGQLHGERASLVLENERGTADFVDEEAFAQIFEGLRGLRLVTLVACHGGAAPGESPLSGLGPGLIRRGVPAVVAMRQAVSFDAARRFTEHFYRHLAQTGVVDRAANEARHQLRLALRKDEEWSTPILSMRLADGRLWTARGPLFPPVKPPASDVRWPGMLERIAKDNLVAILGPGLSRGLLPSAAEIAEQWAAQYDGFPLDGRTDLPAVAQFVEAKEGRGYPQDKLPHLLAQELLERQGVQERRRFSDAKLSAVIDKLADRIFDRDAGQPHRILAALPISTYVTTTCDTLLAAALRFANRSPRLEHCRWREDIAELPPGYDALKGTEAEPLVFHLYGSDADSTSLVVTEDDHLDFLHAVAAEGGKRLPGALKSKLTEAMLLLLGYDVRRLDCRVLLRGVVAHLKNLRRGRIAVLQIDPGQDDSPRTEELRTYMEECCSDVQVEVYWGSVRDFLRELRSRLEEAGGGA